MIVLGMVLVIFIIMGVVIYQKAVVSSEFKLETQGKRVLYTIAENINEMASVGGGYHKCFTLPGELYGGRKYQVLMYSDEPTVFLETEDIIWSAPIATANVSCNMSPPCALDTTGNPMDVWVSNEGGRIVLADHGPCETDWIGIT
jgi:hypothetical protein